MHVGSPLDVFPLPRTVERAFTIFVEECLHSTLRMPLSQASSQRAYHSVVFMCTICHYTMHRVPDEVVREPLHLFA